MRNHAAIVIEPCGSIEAGCERRNIDYRNTNASKNRRSWKEIVSYSEKKIFQFLYSKSSERRKERFHAAVIFFRLINKFYLRIDHYGNIVEKSKTKNDEARVWLITTICNCNSTNVHMTRHGYWWLTSKIWTAAPRVEKYKTGAAVQILETIRFYFATIHLREEVSQICDVPLTRGQPPISLTGHWRILSYTEMKSNQKFASFKVYRPQFWPDINSKILITELEYLIQLLFTWNVLSFLKSRATI